MGEKKFLSEKMIEEALEKMKPQHLQFIDPMKMAQWTILRACAMVDNAVSDKTVERAIESGDLEAYKAGKLVTVEPAKFLLWYKRYKK